MHQLFVTLCSLLVALCHHTSLTARPVEAAVVPMAVQSSTGTANPSMILPDRYQLARYTTEGSYAVSACDSCRGMSFTSVER